MLDAFTSFLGSTGVAALIQSMTEGQSFLEVIGTPLMIIIACVLLYLAIVKKFEPLLLLPIAFGMLLTNLPMFANSGAILMHPEFLHRPGISYRRSPEYGAYILSGRSFGSSVSGR